MIPIRIVLPLALSFALAAATAAQGGQGYAPDDSYWSFGGGDVAHLDVTDNPTGGVWTTATSSGGFTNAADGTQGPDSAKGATTCDDSDTMTNGGGDSYKVVDGKLAKRGADGKYKKGRKIPKPIQKNVRQVRLGVMYFTAAGSGATSGDEEIVSLPVMLP